jgi:hypothetical protein
MQKEAAPCPQRSGDTRLLICVEEEGWVETGGRGTTWRPVSCVVFGSNRASFFDAAIRLGGVPGSSRGENLSDERSPRDLEEAPLKAECSEPRYAVITGLQLCLVKVGPPSSYLTYFLWLPKVSSKWCRMQHGAVHSAVGSSFLPSLARFCARVRARELQRLRAEVQL